MIRLYFVITLILISTIAFSQTGNQLPTVQQKMQALKWIVGKWQGPVYIMGGDGTKQEFKQTVEFAPKLKNSVLVLSESAVRGQDTVFQNIGVFSFDFAQSKYNLKAYTLEGPQIEAEVEVQDKKMIWRVPISGTIIRYTIHLNQKGQWHQIGEASTDTGKTWNSFFESTLSRIK